MFFLSLVLQPSDFHCLMIPNPLSFCFFSVCFLFLYIFLFKHVISSGLSEASQLLSLLLSAAAEGRKSNIYLKLLGATQPAC